MCSIFWLVLLLTTSQTCLAEILLSSDSEVSSEGYFVLSWQSDTANSLSLQQANSENFSQIKTTSLPANGAVTITGLVNGRYFFRVISATEPSNTVLVEVKHHSLVKAFGFFSLGFLLFAVLLLTIFIGRYKGINQHD